MGERCARADPQIAVFQQLHAFEFLKIVDGNHGAARILALPHPDQHVRTAAYDLGIRILHKGVHGVRNALCLVK